jgi:hypothetical protein
VTAHSSSDQPDQPAHTALPDTIPSTEPAAAVEPHQVPVDQGLGAAVDPNAPTMQPDPDNVRGTADDPQQEQSKASRGGSGKSAESGKTSKSK